MVLQVKDFLLSSGNYYVNVGIARHAKTQTVADLHDYLPRHSRFSIIRSDSYVYSYVFDAPLLCSVQSGNATLLSEDVIPDSLAADMQPD